MKTQHRNHVQIIVEGGNFNKKTRNVLTTKNQYGFIYIDGGKWIDLELPNQSSSIKQWTVQKLWLEHNQEPKILHQISPIVFPKLTNLRLAGNNISSLQKISFLVMPFLENLDLTCNNITNLTGLRKATFPNLKKLQLNGNKIKEGQTLQESDLTKLQQISLDAFIHKDVLNEDISWIMRLQTKQLRTIGIRSQRRIADKIKKQKLKTKYDSLMVHARY